ncbi:MAG: NUDIX hydrolase [Candidatus Shapirobacteria bacterium]|nr:NUDIX hydrolase [Candidatus Shapirobacteria bacterium]
MPKWKIITSQNIVNNYYCKVTKEKVLTNKGKIISDYFLISHRDVVMIVPITKLGKFNLIKEYKHGVKKEIFLFPAGLIKDKESPKEAAIRELKEETGFYTENIEYLGELYEFPSNETQKVFIYLAKNLPEKPNQKKDPNEETKLYQFNTNDFKKLIIKNKIKLATTISAFFMAINKSNKK